jgi:DNA excision repair protein ERCC-2
VSLERELIRAYFAENLDSGFEFAYQYPGINRVLQAAGRVIRSESDRGIVLLIDRRYATRRYRTLLGGQPDSVRIKSPLQLAAEVQRFWQKHPD